MFWQIKENEQNLAANRKLRMLGWKKIKKILRRKSEDRFCYWACLSSVKPLPQTSVTWEMIMKQFGSMERASCCTRGSS